MPDTVDKTTRSRIMSCVRAKNTRPEMVVRRALHRAGYRFRLYRRDLPGTPDIILPRYGVAVFVNGCFWHNHGCSRSRLPTTNTEFWAQKFERNQARDQRKIQALEKSGWSVIAIWECLVDSGVEHLLVYLRARDCVNR